MIPEVEFPYSLIQDQFKCPRELVSLQHGTRAPDTPQTFNFFAAWYKATMTPQVEFPFCLVQDHLKRPRDHVSLQHGTRSHETPQAFSLLHTS